MESIHQKTHIQIHTQIYRDAEMKPSEQYSWRTVLAFTVKYTLIN